MNITLNGVNSTVRDGARLLDALATLNITEHQAGVAVAVCGSVVRRADWPTFELSSGDRIEVVTAAQGG